MRRSLLALAALIALALSPYPSSPARASCAGPSLEIPGETGPRVDLRRGQEVTVTGVAFVVGCDDGGGQPAFRCSADDGYVNEAYVPMTDVELVLLQGQPTMTQTSLAVADAEDGEGEVEAQLGEITWTVTIPADQRLGRAVLKTVSSQPLRVRIVP